MNARQQPYPIRRGYVLIVTLGLLVLSTTLLVAVARAAAQHVLQARLDQVDLQRRWGIISCRNAVLPRAEQLLVTTEQNENRAAPECHSIIQLGEDSFTLIVADEQAKANVNRLIDQSGVQSAEDRIRQAISGSGLNNRVRLRPSLVGDDSLTPTAQAMPLIEGPGQIFTDVGPQLLIQAGRGVAPPMQSLTCWGNGLLNIMRADKQSMHTAFTPALTQLEIMRLIDARDKVVQLPITSHTSGATASNQDAITSLLTSAKIDAGKRNKLAITGRSSCHSLWVIVKDRQRSWYWFSVVDDSAKNGPMVQSIVW